MPMSLNINAAYLASHWASVEKGAESVGRTPNRADWKLVREVYVAETDREARRKATRGTDRTRLSRVPAAALR